MEGILSIWIIMLGWGGGSEGCISGFLLEDVILGVRVVEGSLRRWFCLDDLEVCIFASVPWGGWNWLCLGHWLTCVGNTLFWMCSLFPFFRFLPLNTIFLWQYILCSLQFIDILWMPSNITLSLLKLHIQVEVLDNLP